MEKSKYPGLDYLYLLKILAKREEYLKKKRIELFNKLDRTSKYDYVLEHTINLIDGSLSEIGFISQFIYLIGGNNEI